MDDGSSPEILWTDGGGEAFRIDDLLDFSFEDIGAPIGGAGGSNEDKSRPESAFSELNSGDSSVTEAAAAATCEECQRKQSNALLAGADKTWVLGRARSKRSRCVNPAVFVCVAFKNDEPRAGRKAAAAKSSVCSRTPAAVKKAKKSYQTRSGGGQESRRCSHCLVQKTPQWRTGPLGPKTLCNACGVRFKSGRLLPEYRPALSPTFSNGLHSNCHRRVVEIRRQKVDEQQPLPQQETSGLTDNSMADYS